MTEASAITPEVNIEFFVEPFTEGRPGAHVRAAIASFEAQDLTVDVGPFANTASGDLDTVLRGLVEMIRAAMDEGADRIHIHLSRSA